MIIINEDKIKIDELIIIILTNNWFDINFLSRKGFSIKKYENIDIKKIIIAISEYSMNPWAILRFLAKAKIG